METQIISNDMREKLINLIIQAKRTDPETGSFTDYLADFLVKNEVVVLPCRCQECINSVPLDNNCELNTSIYLHCNLWRGEETKNVWHKYKKYYKDYSIVERDGYCDSAEKALKEKRD